MDFVKYVVDNFENVNPDELHGYQLFIYNSIDKYVNYMVPIQEGKIQYNKENYSAYCKLFKESLKNDIINVNMRNSEIYDKLHYDNLDKWTKYSIIKKLKKIEKAPIYKTPHVSKIDNEYINEIISLSQNVIRDISKLYPILTLMNKYEISNDELFDMINQKINEKKNHVEKTE